MHRLFLALGILFLALGGLTLAQRPGAIDIDWWAGPVQLVLGAAMLALAGLAQSRGWGLYRPDPVVESIFERVRVDESYAAADAVKDLLRSGHKLAAIKVYRQVTGVGLKDAEEAVEAVERALQRGNV